MVRSQRLNGLIGVCFFCVAFVAATDVQAQSRPFGPDTSQAPSVFHYAFRGFGIGTLLGLSTGYLIERDERWDGANTRGLAIATGIGALAGTGIGLGIGMLDLGAQRPGVGAIVLRDTLYGTVLGAAVGAVTGGILWLADGSGRDMLLGASIGSLIGAGVGLVVGFIEGPRIVADHTSARRRVTQQRLHFDVGVQRQAESWVVVPGLHGQF
jgi:hypothetical protein